MKIDYSNMTIEELEIKIAENNQEIALLQKKIEQEKKEKDIKFQKVIDLMIEITETEKTYYNYRSILGNAILLGLTENEFDSIEVMMPIYKQKIVLLRNELENLDFRNIL